MKQVADIETAEILKQALSCLEHEGDLVELGCYEGDTSLLLAELLRKNNSQKKLWIYDSFEGLPEKSEADYSAAGEAFKKGELYVSKREVKLRFLRANLPVPVIKKAWFEDLNDEDLPTMICFAFLDGDLYDSIKVSLRLIEKKMTEGGIIVVHDYNNPELPGVTKAVDEWCKRVNYTKLTTKETLAIIKLWKELIKS